MQKRVSGKRATSGKATRRTIETRARRIIADAEGYDADTRRAVERSLIEGDLDTLREIVTRAEAGEIIWDLTGEAPAEDPARTLANHISAILLHPATPADIYNALSDAVTNLDMPAEVVDGAEYIAAVLRHNLKAEGGAK